MLLVHAANLLLLGALCVGVILRTRAGRSSFDLCFWAIIAVSLLNAAFATLTGG